MSTSESKWDFLGDGLGNKNLQKILDKKISLGGYFDFRLRQLHSLDYVPVNKFEKFLLPNCWQNYI